MKEFLEPTLELVTFEGDIITASEDPDYCDGFCIFCPNVQCKKNECDAWYMSDATTNF